MKNEKYEFNTEYVRDLNNGNKLQLIGEVLHILECFGAIDALYRDFARVCSYILKININQVEPEVELEYLVCDGVLNKRVLFNKKLIEKHLHDYNTSHLQHLIKPCS